MLAGYRDVLNATPAEKTRGAAGKADVFRNAVSDATGAVSRAKDEDKYGDAYKALDKCGKAALALQASVNSKQAREHIAALLDHDPNLLESIGPEQLDGLVDSVGSKAGNDADKKLVQAAIKARFGPTLGPDNLGGRYLCRLYKCLAKVPVEHTKNNPKLATINRTRKLFHDGDYLEGHINLNVRTKGIYDKAGAVVGDVVFGNEFGFDQLTLHEVGHAVDDKQGFMARHGKSPAFGGWQEHTVAEVAKAIGEGKKFFTGAAPGLSQDFLHDYLANVLEGKDPKECRGGPPAKDRRWSALASHEATKICKAIKCSGDDGLWDKGNPAAYAINGRVYQESYEGTWTSYDLSARSAKLTNYQFRAAGEWYAESYAAFYRNKLPKSHPLYVELRNQGPAARG
jgi:hypothetical protein